MIARNPKTGAPIRILRSEASLWRNKKTMVWLHNQDTAVQWDRWDTLCIGVEDITKWKDAGKRLDYVALTSSTPETLAFFTTLNPSDYKMLFIPKQLVLDFGWQKFKALQITNLIVLEEAHLMYPFLGDEWSNTREDLVEIVATILRISYLVGMPVDWSSARLQHLTSQQMKIHCIQEQPMPLWYITQYYKPDKARRAREIKKCLEENVKCSIIDKVVLLNEQDFSEDYPKTNKIQQEILGKRLTYKLVIEWIVKNVPDNVICVFGNADIYLDAESFRDVWSVNLENVFLALLRWDVQEGQQPSKLFGPRNDSQDTWGFLSNSVKSKEWDYKSLDFPFGKAGCDNAITVEMLRKKFLIVNPAISIKTHHLQLSNYRTYDVKEIVDKPCYMYVDPTGIHDMEPVYDLNPNLFEKMRYSSFERRLHGTKPKALEVYCKMLERGERYLWKANSSNPFPEEIVQLYKYTDSFQTPQGLTYGYNKIYVGKEEVNKEAWSKSELSPIHPTYQSEKCYAVPWRTEYGTSPYLYCLYFLPKILQLREKYGKGEFFAPEKGVVELLECFQWSEKDVPLLSHRPNTQIWCKEVIQYPFLDKQEIHKEDVDSLRQVLKPQWLENSDSKRWTVMIDGKYITTEMVRKWEAEYPDYEWSVMYEGRTSPDRVFQKLLGASGCIYFGGSHSVSRWGLTWALPRGATCIEIQNEMDPDGEAAHCSGAAGLAHTLVIVPRASDKVTQEMILSEVSQAIQSAVRQGTSVSKKPTVYMPRRSLTGFFGHAGDSFREMVELWAERQYVDAVEDPKAVQIWLNGVSKTLLYDRPTLDWLFTAPQEEQTWELALFGNPAPNDSGGTAKSWFFWPRRPRLVEESVNKGLPQRSFEERSKQLVFYGKIENKVQEKRRKTFDWASVCDDFVLVNGESTPYPFTPSEYLENLSKSKFGLCLAGFGKKCHREVECMAMGCVPVCMTDVDMTNYANPPLEGIHYIRVTHPEEIATTLKAISAEQWSIMSEACRRWWKENASVEGSWNLTQKLISS